MKSVLKKILLFCCFIIIIRGNTVYLAYAETQETSQENENMVEIILNIKEEYSLSEVVSWQEIDNNAIVIIDSTKIIGKQKGEAIIDVTDSLGKVIRYHIIVNENPELIVMEENLIVVIGTQQQLHPSVEGVYTGLISYLTSNLSLLEVNQEGVITGLKEGKGNITISLENGKTKTISVTVVKKIGTVTVKYLEKANQIVLATKQSRVIDASVQINSLLKKTLGKELIYQSQDEKIATVDSNGKIVGKNEGKTSILISMAADPRVTYKLKVTITKRSKAQKLSSKDMKIVGVGHAKYTYTEMQKDLEQLEKVYGDRMEVSTLGESYDKRNIYLVILGNKNAKRKVLIQSAMHGREYMTSQLTMKQIEYYCKNYYSGFYKSKYLSELYDNTVFYIIPMMNPDGVTISQFGAEGIKDKALQKKIKSIRKKERGTKNASYYTRWKANARGVDLNRNFDSSWSTFNDKRSSGASYNYKGKSAVSEKETKLLADLYKEIKPSIAISYHATGSILYWNYGQEGDLLKKTLTWRKRIKSLTDYSLVLGKYSKKKAPGFSDWVSRKKKSLAFTVEIGTKACPLKTSEFDDVWGENKLIYLELAKYK